MKPLFNSKEELASCIDSTCLKPNCSITDVKKLCEDAKKYKFHSVVVYPLYINYCKLSLSDSSVKVCSVVGFPFGKEVLDVKRSEVIWSAASRVDEIDFVMNYSELDFDMTNGDEIASISDLCAEQGIISKVILETCFLTFQDILYISGIAMNAGVDFIKTSTGFGSRGATTEDVRLIKSIVGDRVGIKAAGGIKSYQDVCDMVECGATRIGTSNAVKIIEECNLT
jgi:deoxyribose-phosphate aldolase